MDEPILGYYDMQVWMSAALPALPRIAVIQRRALDASGDACYLPSLVIRRTIAALCNLFKLHYLSDPAIVKALLPGPSPSSPSARTTVRAVANHQPFHLAKPDHPVGAMSFRPCPTP